MMFHLVLCKPLPPQVMALMDKRPDVRYTLLSDVFRGPPNNEKLAASIHDADAIMIRLETIDETLLAKAAKLKIISRYGVGYDLIDVNACTRHGVLVGVLNGTNDLSVAEHTMMLMLSVARRTLEMDASVRAGTWMVNAGRPMHELGGRRVLVIGFSRIGSRVARLCRAFGMEVLISDPGFSPLAIEAEGFIPVLDPRSVLPEVDVVTLHCPLVPATRKMVDADFLGRMKRTAWLINTARGGIVDEAALVRALADGTIEAAGLDVLAKEPAPKDNPLFALPGVVVSPHNATATEECDLRMAERAVLNMLEVLDGHADPRFMVNVDLLLRQAG